MISFLSLLHAKTKQNINHEYTCKLYGYVAFFLLDRLQYVQHKHKQEKMNKNKHTCRMLNGPRFVQVDDKICQACVKLSALSATGGRKIKGVNGCN